MPFLVLLGNVIGCLVHGAYIFQKMWEPTQIYRSRAVDTIQNLVARDLCTPALVRPTAC